VGYFGYELAGQFDRVSFRAKKGPAPPQLGLLYFRDLVVFDHKKEIYYLISRLIPKKGVSFETAYRQAEGRLEEMKAAFKNPDPLSQNGRFQFEKFRPEISRGAFERIVRKAKDYICAGDIYQANLSQRFSFRFEGSALRLYESLRKTNPSPFAAALRFGDFFVASSSPELLLMKKGNLCVTRPIAGTRPRGRGARETRRLSEELLANEKERAEHLMLVDLERNDLGRVSKWRSVRVRDFMCLEKYARVIHIVSEIAGKLRPGKDVWDVIQAMFPGGTITGCPKIRSMEVIDELEPVKRGLYTGSLGFVGFDGNAMLNIAIRTLLLQKGKGHVQVGAGIVADSDPEREYEETLAKGEALVAASS
jgi:anthranilate/para-aminobenzoate synthase component I